MATTSTRIGTLTNLQPGGQYDLLLIKFVGTYPVGQIGFGFYETPMKISGLQKVSQMFIKILLTTKGSDPIYPQMGTFFSELTIGANQTLDDTLYLSTLNESIQSAAAQTKSLMNAQNTDLSSCLDSVTLAGIDKVEDSIVMYIVINTSDGVSASIAMPFPEFGLSTPYAS